MQRISAEYVVSVKVDDINISDSPEDMDKLIKEEGQRKLRLYITGNLFDPDGVVIHEQV